MPIVALGDGRFKATLQLEFILSGEDEARDSLPDTKD